MILTPIPRERLDGALDRFAAQLDDPAARAAFARIRATTAERAEGAAAETHRQQALALARDCGMRVHPAGTRSAFNWDGTALDGDTEAYVILHEAAHFVLAPPERRILVDFGLGAGPDTIDRSAADRAARLPILERERDEAAASLLGILWEAALGHPALASFLDQNWLEGLERSAAPAASHFIAVFRRLRLLGLVEATMAAAEVQPSAREIRKAGATGPRARSSRQRANPRLHAGSGPASAGRSTRPSSRTARQQTGSLRLLAKPMAASCSSAFSMGLP